MTWRNIDMKIVNKIANEVRKEMSDLGLNVNSSERVIELDLKPFLVKELMTVNNLRQHKNGSNMEAVG